MMPQRVASTAGLAVVPPGLPCCGARLQRVLLIGHVVIQTDPKSVGPSSKVRVYKAPNAACKIAEGPLWGHHSFFCGSVSRPGIDGPSRCPNTPDCPVKFSCTVPLLP